MIDRLSITTTAPPDNSLPPDTRDELKERLLNLHKNLNILQEREAKYGGNAPLELLNQLDDHQTAIELVQQTLAGELSSQELDEALAPLNLALGPGINVGDIEGSYVAIGTGAKLIVNQALSAVEEAKKERDQELTLLAEAVVNLAGRLQQVALNPPATGNLTNPYKSLLDYRLEDAALFYGRSQAIEQMLAHMQRHPLTILHAESGSGKTSLLQAGLASRLLTAGNLPLHIRPCNVNPGLAVKRAILPNLTEAPGLENAPLADFLRKVTQILGPNSYLYLFLDQFEEFFTQLDEAIQPDFITQLGLCLEDESLRVRWVLAMRKEYFGNLATFRPQIKNPFANDYYLRALNYAEATEVIVEPAKKQGLAYEPALVDKLLADLGANPDGSPGELAPPHIQLVCSAMFEQWQERRAADATVPPLITLQLYDEAGGAQGILRGHLNRVLQRTLSQNERELAWRLLTALVSSDQQRIRRSRDNLSATLANYLVGGQSLDDVLEPLVESRLLKIEEDEHTNSTVYELAHDYLLAEIQVEPGVQAAKAAQELLEREVESFKKFNTILSPDKFDIINSQKAYLVISDEAKELLRQSKAAKERILRRIAIIAVIIIAILSFTTWRAIERRIEAEVERQVAQVGKLSAQALNLLNSDSQLSLTLSLEALNKVENLESKDTLRQVLPAIHPWQGFDVKADDVLSADWTPDGRQVALGLNNGDIQLWDAETHTLLKTLKGHTNPVYGLAFNPRGTHLISTPWESGGTDHNPRLWDVASGQTVGLLEGHKEGVFNAAWSPDGTRILTASEDGMVGLWDVTTMKPLAMLPGHTGRVFSVAWRPDGKQFISVGDNGEMFVWDTETLKVVKRLTGHQGTVFTVAWSPLGDRLATGASDNTVRLWDASDYHILDVLVGHTGWVRQVNWHPDGRLLASASGDTRVIIWDTAANRAVSTLTGHPNWVRRAVWSPDGNSILSTGRDGAARLWNMQERLGLTVLEGHVGEVNWVAWHPGGSLLASAGDDGEVRIWQPETGQTIQTLRGHEGVVWDVTWSPDGALLATVGEENVVRLWSTVTMQNTAVLTGHTDFVNQAAFSPDGLTLASASDDGSVKLWDVKTGVVKRTLTGHKKGDSVLAVAFSPDGSKLASGSVDKTIILWDPVNGQALKTLTGHTDLVWNVVFSPDGQSLASGSQDGTAKIWNVTTGEVSATLRHPKPVNGLAWSHDGTQLATASDDGVARLWDVAGQTIIADLTGHQGGVLNVAWRPDDARLATSSTDGVVRIFPTNFDEVRATAKKNQQRQLTPEEKAEYLGE